ncbi:MAG: hypothetical protein KC620_16050 [Myxococcales bacterium]|nr:hypothetical protein [Myxococcales bacterium]
MLLGFVRVAPQRRGHAVAWRLVDGFEAHEALQAMDAPTRDAPLALIGPGQPIAQRLGGAPAVRVAEPRQQAAGHVFAKGLDELLAQQAQRDRVEQQRALAAEVDEAALGIEVEQVVQAKIGGVHIVRLSK